MQPSVALFVAFLFAAPTQHAQHQVFGLEQFRYEQVAKEMYRLTSQNYQQFTRINGAPADWAVWQLARAANGNPRLTKVYMEQISHRPPVTALIFEGPDGLWTLTGWASWGAKAWINSAALVVEGRKTITFKDGGKITFSNSSD